jgi:hypothetical protein
MERRDPVSNGHADGSSNAPAPPVWLRQTARHALQARGKMLEHIARRRSMGESKASDSSAATRPSPKGAREFAREFAGYMVIFGLIALVCQSRFPVLIGAFLFFTDDAFITWVLETIGIRVVPDTLAAEFIKFFVFLVGWGALLGYWRNTAPAWLLPWMPPSESWSFLAGIALLLAVVMIISSAIMRRGLPRVGVNIEPRSLVWTTIQLLIGLGLVWLLALLDPNAAIPNWLGGH